MADFKFTVDSVYRTTPHSACRFAVLIPLVRWKNKQPHLSDICIKRALARLRKMWWYRLYRFEEAGWEALNTHLRMQYMVSVR
jgi:hypothetical protein